MLKKLLTTLLSGLMIISGISLPILANEQDTEIEEMEYVVEKKNNGSSKEINESNKELKADPYETPGSLGILEREGLAYQLFEDGHANVQGGTSQTITEVFIPSKVSFKGIEYKVLNIGHDLNYNKSQIKFKTRFTELPNLKKVTIEEGIETVANTAFGGCQNLEAIIFPNTITRYGQEVLYNCPKLKSVSLSNQASIHRHMFSNCTSLEEIEIPDGVLGIAGGAFEACPNLRKIIIPSSVNELGDYKTATISDSSPNVIIYGSIPSAAYNYAKKYGIPFKELDLEPLPNTPTNGEMHRLYNPNSGEHFYTGNPNEKNQLSSLGWKYEGVAWYAPQSSNTPVYRLYNKNSSDHHYTTDSNEKDTLVRSGWKDEGIGWYSDDQKGVPLYRVYNPKAQAGSHHYTTDKTEQDYLVGIGWNNEGIAWYGLK